MLETNYHQQRVACVVPTYNGKDDLERLLDSLRIQTVSFDLLLVDSSSTDGTKELAQARKEAGEITQLVVISGAEFNHGGTRQMMVNEFSDYDIYVFLTQDAVLEDRKALANILQPFEDPQVGAVCGRQRPHHDANLLAQHARLFNYPEIAQIKTRADIPTLGIKAAFMSNSFSAYRGDALLAVGGFPNHVVLSEDMFVSAKMLLSDFKLVYAGAAVCRHSHNYSLQEEFRRYFDIGVFHAREPWIRQEFGGAGGEGVKYVKSELRFLGFKHLYLWPAAIVRNTLKLLAYKLGQREACLPVGLKKKIGMYKGYWSGPNAEKH